WNAQAPHGRRPNCGIGRAAGAGTGRRQAALLPAHSTRTPGPGGRKPAARRSGSHHPRQARPSPKAGAGIKRLTLRLYGALAAAFPHEFKNVYGDQLIEAGEDAIEPVWRSHGALGLARLLFDIAVRLPAEHLAELSRDIRYGLRMLAASPGFT